VEPLDRFPFEHSAKHSNLLMAAFQRIYEINNSSDWYFLVEDDTIVVKDNLEELVRSLTPNRFVWLGKCVKTVTNLKFMMGGAGILMSHKLLHELHPYLPECRQKFNYDYGDARIANCINHYVVPSFNRTPTRLCDPRGFRFSSSLDENGSRMIRYVTLHEKSPIRIKRLNEIILNHANNNVSFTSAALTSNISYWRVDDNGVQMAK